MVNTSLLKAIRFADVTQWNVTHFFATEVMSQYSLDPIGKHTIHITQKTKLFEEPEKEYKILGISNECGMFDAYSEFGRNINQPYIYVESGCLAYNPYRINVGSIGIKTEELENEYISPAYVVFKCRKTIIPEYLFLVLKSNPVSSIIKEKTTGSVRQTLSYDNLASIKIPVPSIEVQKALLQKYHSTLMQADSAKEEALSLEKSIDNTICELLQITLPENRTESVKGLHFQRYSECDKWSVDYLLNKNSCDFIETTSYPIVYARYFIRDCQYGLSEKASVDKIGLPILRMNNLQNSRIDTTDLKYLSMDTKAIDKYILNQGDLLFNRTNSKELVGKTAVFDLQGEYVFASYLIRIVIDSAIAHVKYINYLFASKIIRSQIDLFSRQVLGQANINVDEIKSLRVPLPPLEKQQEIVSIIDAIKSKADDSMRNHFKLAKKARAKFEEAIFSEA